MHLQPLLFSDEILQAVVVTAVSVSCVFILAISAVLTYKYRYRASTLLCCCKRLVCCECLKKNIIYKYDVFLSYCGEDRHFIIEHLLPNLEDKHGLRCCVHERDFPVSGALEEVIQQHMRNSRVLIIVISSTSIRKHWTTFELRVAKYMDLFHRKRVLYIKLDDLGADVPSMIKSIISSNIYHEWPGNGNKAKEDMFWAKTVAAIHGDLDCCQCFGNFRHIAFEEEDVPLTTDVGRICA